MQLPGPWRAKVADEDLRREFHTDGLDERDWLEVAVPGHWMQAPELADEDGPVLYRTWFDYPEPADDHRCWLRLDGVFSQGDVWLDSAYVGDTDGYFFPHSFEVTDLLRERSEHLLAVEVSCPPITNPDEKRALTGAFQDPEHFPGAPNPGGIWQPVHIVETGPVAIRYGRVICHEATEERGVLALRLVVDTATARTVTLRTTVAGIEVEDEHSLAAGENRIEWTITVPEAERWWPHSLGEPTRYDVDVQVLVNGGDAGTQVSDSRRWKTGFRSIEMRNWRCSINGERLFLKGVALSPERADLANATPADLRATLRQVKEAGMDFVRVHRHVSVPMLYELADELGLLVWQDLPLAHKFARGVRQEAMRQAREAVDLLGHHPSVFLWCAHDEPYAPEPTARAAFGTGLIRQQIPTWNRTMLDRSLKRVLAKNDGSRPVIAHSGVAPHLPQLDGTDAHLWFGWREGDPSDLADFSRRLPRHVRFVSAFGAQSVPVDADFVHEADWPLLNWNRLAGDHGLDVETMTRAVPPGNYADFVSWKHATQDHQAVVIRRTIEVLRRVKYRPTGGFCAFRLRDATPQIGFGLLGHDGRPKPAWEALRVASQPIIVVADLLDDTIAPGASVRLAVHVVSDEHQDRPGGQIRAHISSPVGRRSWAWTGDIDADECTRVGEIRWAAPTLEGPVVLDLELDLGPDYPGGLVRNQYHSFVGSPGRVRA